MINSRITHRVSSIPHSALHIPHLLDPFEVLTAARVYFDAVPFVDEQGDVYDEARFEAGGLGSACRGVAPDSRLTLHHFQYYGGRHVYIHEAVVVHQNINVIPFADVAGGTAKQLPAEGHLVVSFGVHEVVYVAIGILEL